MWYQTCKDRERKRQNLWQELHKLEYAGKGLWSISLGDNPTPEFHHGFFKYKTGTILVLGSINIKLFSLK